MANQNNALVILAKDKDQNSVPVTTSEIIADALKKEHKDVILLLKKYIDDFKPFGLVSFKTKPIRSGKGGTQKKEIAILNEHQATLLITYMRNNEKVRKFKVALVKAFYDMKESLSQPKQYIPPFGNKLEQTSEVFEYDLTTIKKAKESLHWWNTHREEAQDMCYKLTYAQKILEEELAHARTILDQFSGILRLSSLTGEAELARLISQLEIIDRKREAIPKHMKNAI